MFRFTIRDLVLLTLVVGLAVGWFLSAQRWNRECRQLKERNVALKNEADLAKEQADKAWAALNDPFYRPNPLDDVFQGRRLPSPVH